RLLIVEQPSLGGIPVPEPGARTHQCRPGESGDLPAPVVAGDADNPRSLEEQLQHDAQHVCEPDPGEGQPDEGHQVGVETPHRDLEWSLALPARLLNDLNTMVEPKERK